MARNQHLVLREAARDVEDVGISKRAERVFAGGSKGGGSMNVVAAAEEARLLVRSARSREALAWPFLEAAELAVEFEL